MAGLIALDIDGTLTVPGQPISRDVISYLCGLVQEKWQFLFITGRSLHWSRRLLESLPFPYFLSVQNGSATLEMPLQKLIAKKYLEHNVIPILQTICTDLSTDFVIYTGYENDDICYYRTAFFPKSLLEYLQTRALALQENWQEVPSFDGLIFPEFPSAKCFGRHAIAEKLAAKIEQRLNLHAPVIRDPFDESYYVVQATHAKATKGQALKELVSHLGLNGEVIIAAGDDLNDRSMLAEATIKVVMETAPPELRAEADIIAPSAVQGGIIAGLRAALLHSL